MLLFYLQSMWIQNDSDFGYLRIYIHSESRVSYDRVDVIEQCWEIELTNERRQRRNGLEHFI